MKGPVWNRLAAATGIFFAVLIAAAAIVGESKDIALAADAAKATNEVFGTFALLIGAAGACLFWFSGTLAARLRQLEGGSGRLAAVVNSSGGFIAGSLAVSAGVLFAARNYGGADIAPLASAILDGPTLLFPAAAYVGAAGVVGVRAEGLPAPSVWTSRLSVPLAAAFIGGAGLQIFQNYAWINDTAYIAFVVWVLVVSSIGVARWTQMDGPREEPPEAHAPAPLVPLDEEEEADVRPRARKPASRKPAKRPPARKR